MPLVDPASGTLADGQLGDGIVSNSKYQPVVENRLSNGKYVIYCYYIVYIDGVVTIQIPGAAIGLFMLSFGQCIPDATSALLVLLLL